MMAGYWHRQDDLEKAIRGGWLHTGDAGAIDERGFIYIKDRIKDMIISGGENIYPAEIERVLAEHPEVADVAVIAVPDDKWGEAVKAVVIRTPGGTISADELVAWSRSRLAGFKRPRSVDFVDSLPRNASGKVLKKDLREPYWTHDARRVH
jgi:acyl-CoA synthetase (AMP-forming)/AMP-acid ligase II